MARKHWSRRNVWDSPYVLTTGKGKSDLFFLRQVAHAKHEKHMNEFEKLAWMIAEEFVEAFESLEALLLAEPEEETKPLVMAAKA